MTRLEMLSSNTHRNCKINDEFRPGLGYDQGAVMVLPSEIQDLQREFAILFRKHPETGQLYPNALLGLEENENLFLGEQGQWLANYLPVSFAKGPFFVGFEQQGEQQNPVVSIDMADPRVNQQKGKALFSEQGEPSEYLNNINQHLATMHEDLEMISAMINAFNQAQLIEPVTIDIELDNGRQFQFAGAYTIAEEKLRALDAETLAQLNQAGFLSAAYYIAGSLPNIQRLIDAKNQRNSQVQ